MTRSIARGHRLTAVNANAGVVDEDVQSAEPRGGRVDRARDVGVPADVGLKSLH